MRMICGACALLMWLGIAAPVAGAATEGRNVTLAAAGGAVSAELFEAAGDDRRPAVILLHGQQGLAPFRAFYRSVGAALAAAGIDAYLVTYYRGDEARRANDPDSRNRAALFSERMRSWAQLINTVADDVRAGRHASGRIGVLGFSLGGYVATATAARDPRIAALAVFYGGIPDVLKDEITHLPPLLELHGDADRVVPLADGKALVALATKLGQPAENVVYPGAGHGFSDADNADARRRMVGFFRTHLLRTR